MTIDQLDRFIAHGGLVCGGMALVFMGVNSVASVILQQYLGDAASGPGLAVLRDPSPSVSAFGAIPIAGERP